jgi:hypothetical protein
LRYLKNYIIRVLVAFVIINLVNNGALFENVKNRVIESYNLKDNNNNAKIVVDKTIKSVKSREKLVKNNNKEKNIVESNHEVEYAIIRDNEPVFWCTDEILVEINNKNMPENGNIDLNKAFGEINKALGIRFKVVGYSNDIPMIESYKRGGEEIKPVLIGWSTPNESDLLLKGALGGAVGNPAKVDNSYRLVTGAVAYNTEYNDSERKFNRVNLYVHELLHVLGLGHSHDKDNIMFTHIGENTKSLLERDDIKQLSKKLRCIS